MSNKKNKRLVKLRKPKSDFYYGVYLIYKDKLCYVHDYHSAKSLGVVAVGNKDEFLFWYPAKSVEYISSGLIRCDIKIV